MNELARVTARIKATMPVVPVDRTLTIHIPGELWKDVEECGIGGFIHQEILAAIVAEIRSYAGYTERKPPSPSTCWSAP